jgi:uncharacterized membrane protein YdbT with pleckstrin-like domain
MADSYLNKLLGDNEQVMFVARRHWTVLALEVLSETILAIALIVLITLMLVFATALGPLAVFSPFFALGYLLLVFPLASLTRDWMIWSNRKFVITSRRVIQLSGVLNKDVTDSSLEMVNDVKLDQTFWGRLLNYGDVEILTASDLGVNKFKTLGDPVRFKTAMLNAKNKLDTPAMPAAPTAPAAPPTPDVPTLLAQLDGLRQHGVLTEAEFQAKKAQLLAKM